MSRKRKPVPASANGATKKTTPGRPGRPPLPPRTAFARWIRAEGITVAETASRLAGLARRLEHEQPELGITSRSAPSAKTLLDSVNGRHKAPLDTILLVHQLTGGKVGLPEFVTDQPRRRTAPKPRKPRRSRKTKATKRRAVAHNAAPAPAPDQIITEAAEPAVTSPE